VSLTIPSGWTVDSETASDDLRLVLPDGSDLELTSTQMLTRQSALDLLQSLVANEQQQLPDFQTCGDETAAGIGGVNGVWVSVCYTLPAPSGQPVAAAASYWIGTNTLDTTYYGAFLYSTQASIRADLNAIAAALGTVRWKLA